MPARQVVIDACSAINLLATGREVEIVRALDWSLLILPEAKAEAGYLFGPPDDDGQPTRVPVDWTPLEGHGLIDVQPLGDECLDAYISAAARLTDVDAKAVALAGTMGLPLLSDDGKVRRTFGGLYPRLPVHSVLGMVREAAAVHGLKPPAVAEILWKLRKRANFAPPRWETEREWFVALLGS